MPERKRYVTRSDILICLRTLHRRAYFYVGQTYIAQGNSSIAAGQMYIEHLTPAAVTQPFPILFIHGLGMTGTNFLNTPDGRLGWADYFLSKGYELYIVDQPSRARSPWQPTVDGVLVATDTFTAELHFTAVERFKFWPQAVLHTQWPGNGSVGDPTFDKFYASMVPSLNSTTEQSPVILMSHSQSGPFGWILADSRPKQVKAISFPPFTPNRTFGLTDIPIAYDPPITNASEIGRVVVRFRGVTCFQQTEPARKLINLADIPVLVVTSEASYHAQYDDCSVEYLRQAGVSTGNGHMFFMEKNGIQIADQVIRPWISKIRK
ncbi:Alpha/Beta hydrolase protein [Mycena olivaceomarginata]|nr:Alpha/Beta hydrolase protein [Mycena olivaceomarginata]